MKSQWRWLAGAAMLLAVVCWTGSRPFVSGVRALDAEVLVLGAALAAVSTAAGAWRWHLVAQELGVAIPMPTAVAACYRAQFLNCVLPGGVLGDVHRGVVHGRTTGETGRALRAVGWERLAGQVVQAVMALVVLTVLPSPMGPSLPWAIVLAGTLLIGVAHGPPSDATARTSTWHRVLRGLKDDVRCALLGRRCWPSIAAASVLAVSAHIATFLLAARAVGVTAPLSTQLPLAFLVLVAAGLPLNLAGWGPREGMAAWAFASSGLGADTGVATAVAFGTVVFVAHLPGLAVLLCGIGGPVKPATTPGRARARPAGVAGGGGRRA